MVFMPLSVLKIVMLNIVLAVIIPKFQQWYVNGLEKYMCRLFGFFFYIELWNPN